MRRRLPQGIAEGRAIEARFHVGAAGRGIEGEEPGVGRGRQAKSARRGAGAEGVFGQAVEPGIVGIEDRRAARGEPGEDLRLGRRDARLAIGEVLDVHGLHVGDGHRPRLDHARERGDLTGVVHADLEDGALCFRRHAGEGQRNADMIVVALDRAVGGPCEGEAGADGLGDAGLAHRSGDRAPPRAIRADAGGFAERFQPSLSVVNGHGGSKHVGRGQNARGPRLHCGGHKTMAVALRSEGDKEIPRLQGAAVDGDAACAERLPGGASAGGPRDLVGGPQRRCHAAVSTPSARRSSSASSKGWVTPAMVWPVSWPLPATTRMSPA